MDLPGERINISAKIRNFFLFIILRVTTLMLPKIHSVSRRSFRAYFLQFFICVVFPLTILMSIMLIDKDYSRITYEIRLGERSPPGSPWPMPKSRGISYKRMTVDPAQFIVFSAPSNCDVLNEALKRYNKIITTDCKGFKHDGLPMLEGLQVKVKSGYTCGYPKDNDIESYTLAVLGGRIAELQAESVWGALRGLETFSQLVYEDEDNHVLINLTKIQDEPRYKYRGILLDSARHYLPIEILKMNLDAMAYNKFNVLHWHIIDDQSFPFESKIFPNLTQLGAYSPKHVYTQDDIRDLIQYARLRGIRVIPEFDTPGHTQAIGKAFPGVLTPCYGEGKDKPYTANYPEHAAAEILNPMIDETYDVFKTLVEEVKQVFVDEYIHLGMDEVRYACWKSNPNIAEFMKKQNYTNYNQVEEYYVRKTLENVKDTGYKYIIWQDPIDNGVQAEKESVIEIWKDINTDKTFTNWQNYTAAISKKGYQIILTSCWYLNRITLGQDWRKFYECDPRNFTGTEEDKNKVIGGEVCMWGEYVDGTNILPRMWPRASAVAERLWSPAEITNDTDSATFRLDEHRCRMLKRGIPAQPLVNGFCGDYEWGMHPNAKTDTGLKSQDSEIATEE